MFIIMKLESPQFQAILTPEVKQLTDLFHHYGYELRIAGGAVRDLLMGKKPDDIDFATTATPEQMKEMFITEDIRIISTKGESHGTIFIRMNGKENFEITTLRIDVTTDGRHADVVFTTDWQLDASRRDLTINSMFLGLDGTLYDYFHGMRDLENHKVSFVGDPSQRIKEDYLRILRYFRFYGKVATVPNSHEAETLEAIRKNMDGLAGISGERIWTELKKILDGNHCVEIIDTIIGLGMAQYIGLPQNPGISELKKIYKRCLPLKPHPMTVMTALLNNIHDLEIINARLKLSNYETNLSNFIICQRPSEVYKEELKPYQALMVKLTTGTKLSDMKEWICELFKYKGNKELLELFRDWEIPKFPVTGNMLQNKGLKPGIKFKTILNDLKEIWINSNFTMTSEELLEHLPKL